MPTDIDDSDCNRHWDLHWNNQLGVRYHMHMQRYYERLGRFITAFSLVMSSAAFAVLFGTNSTLAKYLAAMVAMAQTLELVIDTKGKSALHNSLRQRYIQLDSLLAGKSSITIDEERAFAEKRAAIEIEEPPVINSLMDKCHNEVAKVKGLDVEHFTVMGRWSSCVAFWYS